jgi:aspartate/tyrosine/aromatic aminotransferase
MFEIIIQEEVFGAGTSNPLPVTIAKERLTLADLIMEKARAKAAVANRQLENPQLNQAFISEKEQLLNESLLEAKRQKLLAQAQAQEVDAEKAGYEALAAFQQNGFFVIVDGQQRESLEEELLLSPESKIHFIRLVPLVGG